MVYNNIIMDYFGSKQCRKISNCIIEDNSRYLRERQPKVGVSASFAGTFKADYKLSSSVFERREKGKGWIF